MAQAHRDTGKHFRGLRCAGTMRDERFAGKDAQRSRIFIVRHAQSAANAGESTVDPATIPITGRGARQARYLAEFISERPSVVAVSRYLRSVQTVEALSLRFPGLRLEEWRIEEFTYLNPASCAGTTYVERRTLREAYWNRCQPSYVDGPGCESFSDFIARVRQLEHVLSNLRVDDTAIVITHGFVMRALLWFQQSHAGAITRADMAGFANFRRRVSVPNCAILLAEPSGDGLLRLSERAFVSHIPVDLQSE
jgi:probable phosphoglycerate mutase